MKKKILTTSLALALGLTLVVPTATAKADELDDLLNGATEIGGELDQNTEDLNKLNKKKVVPAAKIEDIAKPNKKEDKPSNKDDKKEDEKNKDNKDDDKSKKDEKDDVKKKLENNNKKVENKANTNVKTGVGSISAIVGLLSASIGGLFYTKKNK